MGVSDTVSTNAAEWRAEGTVETRGPYSQRHLSAILWTSCAMTFKWIELHSDACIAMMIHSTGLCRDSMSLWFLAATFLKLLSWLSCNALQDENCIMQNIVQNLKKGLLGNVFLDFVSPKLQTWQSYDNPLLSSIRLKFWFCNMFV